MRGLTKVELADRIDVSTAAVGQYESAKSRPRKGVLAQISIALGFPVAFFEARDPVQKVSEDATNFRRLRSVSRRSRNRLLAQVRVLADVLTVLEDHVELPEVDLPESSTPLDRREEDIEAAAGKLRQAWGLGDAPIDSIVRLIESHGVLIAQLASENDGVDAFSLLLRDRPLIVLVKDKADAARSNFDAAHELGHLLLHHDAEPANVVREHEANAFASAFLMPATAMLRELPGRVDWQALMALKRRWHVSLQALLYRARTLGRISESAYKRAMVRISAAGWRTHEPGNLGDPEAPTLIAKSVSLLEEAGILGRIDLARLVRINADMLEDFIPAPAPRPRVVVS
jgi:Zn-dependent peptidase ImmA (M78 family)/DNA-binding XRE family transcriptional regulator